jgi:hypothetical protein
MNKLSEPNDILLKGSPSMQFADESGSDPSTLGWTSKDELDKNDTSSPNDESEDICEEDDDEETGFEDGDTNTMKTIGIKGSSTSSFLNFSAVSSSEVSVSIMMDELLPQIAILPPTPQTFSPNTDDPSEWDVSDLNRENAAVDAFLRAHDIERDEDDDDMTPAFDETEFCPPENDLNRIQPADGYRLDKYSTADDLNNIAETNLIRMERSMRHSTSGELQTLTAVRFLSNRSLIVKRSMSLDTFEVLSKKWPPIAQKPVSATDDMIDVKRKNRFSAGTLTATICGQQSTLHKWLQGSLPTGFPRTNPYVSRTKHFLSPDTCHYMKHGPIKLFFPDDEPDIVAEPKAGSNKPDRRSSDPEKIDEVKTNQETPAKKKGFASFFWHRQAKQPKEPKDNTSKDKDSKHNKVH